VKITADDLILDEICQTLKSYFAPPRVLNNLLTGNPSGDMVRENSSQVWGKTTVHRLINLTRVKQRPRRFCDLF
jgi:hypothetical protein